MSKTLHRNLQSKIDALQGPEWDSSDEEEAAIATKKTNGQEKKAATAKKLASKKVAKKKVDIKAADEEENKQEETEKDATVIYIGHLPSEFEERELKNFLQQFGKVVNIRISRSVKTGNSRGYAFARFTDAETSRIVAETLQGYFLGQRRLVCHVVPNPRRGIFFNTDKIVARRQINLKVEEKTRQRNLSNVGKMKEITARLVSRERKKRAKLAEMGIEYDFPGYEALHDADEEAKKGGESLRETMVEDEADEPTKKSKRKDSIGSQASTGSKKKRKDTIGSETSSKRNKTKDSVDTIESAKNMDVKTPPKKSTRLAVQSEKKKKNDLKTKKRRVSTR